MTFYNLQGRATGTRERFKIDEDSLHKIRSKMPTENMMIGLLNRHLSS